MSQMSQQNRTHSRDDFPHVVGGVLLHRSVNFFLSRNPLGHLGHLGHLRVSRTMDLGRIWDIWDICGFRKRHVAARTQRGGDGEPGEAIGLAALEIGF